MTETENAINVLVQHFLLDDEKPSVDVTNALATIGTSRPFEALGYAMFAAILKTHIARLQADKATLVAQGLERNIH